MESSKSAGARQRAEEKFAKTNQRDVELRTIQRQRQDAEAAKLAHLRSLRLAKEAAERSEALARQIGNAASRAKRSKAPIGKPPIGKLQSAERNN